MALSFLALVGTTFGSEPLVDKTSQAVVHWRGECFQAGDWPEELEAQVGSELMRWSPLAEQLGYRCDMSEDGRVLVYSSSRFNRSVRRESKLVEDTLQACDETLGEYEGSTAPVVLIRAHDRSDYQALLDFIGSTRPYLGEWCTSVKDQSSFRLEEPNCAAWVEREVKHASENELARGLAHCLVTSRYGQPPAWLHRGVAWHVEYEVCKSIRTLQGAEEQRGWEDLLKSEYAKREGIVLTAEDFDRLSAKSCDELQAGMAWGMVQFLDEYHPRAIGGVLSDLGRYASQNGRVEAKDGRMVWKDNYRVPTNVQSSVMRRHVEGDAFAEATRSFQLGSRYRPMPVAK